MTTTGEYLVSISTLATGSALDHFLNIETGSGTGDPYPVPVDAILAALEGDAIVVADDEVYVVTLDADDLDSELGSDLDADLEGDASVEREC